MIEEMLRIEGVLTVAIEPNKITVQGESESKWDVFEKKIITLIECVLGENGDFLPVT
jgi:hypothetical protein